MKPQLFLATMSKPFQHLKNPKKTVLQSPFHHSRTWDVLNISTSLSTGDRNVQGCGLYSLHCFASPSQQLYPGMLYPDLLQTLVLIVAETSSTKSTELVLVWHLEAYYHGESLCALVFSTRIKSTKMVHKKSKSYLPRKLLKSEFKTLLKHSLTLKIPSLLSSESFYSEVK